MSFLDFMHDVGKLKKTKRTGWVNYGIKDAESVAEHSYRMVFMSMLLAKKYNLDEHKLMKIALVHDLAEARVGDIVTEVGAEITGDKEEKKQKEIAAMKEICAQLENGDEVFAIFMEYENQESAEAKFMKKLDKLEMTIQALEYEEEKHPEKLDDFWQNARKHLKESDLYDLFEELVGKRYKKTL